MENQKFRFFHHFILIGSYVSIGYLNLSINETIKIVETV